MPELFLLIRRWTLMTVLPVIVLVACTKAGQPEPESEPEKSSITGYWDAVNLNSDSLILNPRLLLKPTLNFFMMLENTKMGKEAAVEAFMQKLVRSDTSILQYMMDNVIEKYLYEAGSPVRNDATYLMMLRYLLNDSRLDSLSRNRFTNQIRLLNQNLPGHQANNFEFQFSDGQISDLYRLSEVPVLLYFNNPDCEACKQTTQLLAGSEVLNTAIKANDVQVVTVYADRDLTMWQSVQFPVTWKKVNSIHPDSLNVLYDLRAIPCMYLLDSQKRVVIKDGLADEILLYLKQMQKL